MRFDELDLNDRVLDALYDMRFDTCTPIQEKCIPEILTGRDLIGVAQTGTGKTAAYLLPILSKLQDGGYPNDFINCVIMSPTRELAQQIDQAMQGFGYYLDGISSVAIYGGNDGNRYDQEIKSLGLGADVVIATPGRLLSHLSMGNADFSKVSFFVLDEADRMLDMGFSEDIMKIASHLPAHCQTIMYSATMPDKIEDLAHTLLKNPVEVKIAVSKPAEKIKQTAYICYEEQKMGIIKNVFKKGGLKRVIIFSGKKQKVKIINKALAKLNINSGEMHSDLDQLQRDEIMYKFKSGQIDVLVATDIVARGIDIDDISIVINFDVPRDTEDYVHRIGRTARADRDGMAITFVADSEISYFKQIEKMLEMEIEKLPLPEEFGSVPKYAENNKANRRDKKKAKRKKHVNDSNQNKFKDAEEVVYCDSKSRIKRQNQKRQNQNCVDEVVVNNQQILEVSHHNNKGKKDDDVLKHCKKQHNKSRKAETEQNFFNQQSSICFDFKVKSDTEHRRRKQRRPSKYRKTGNFSSNEKTGKVQNNAKKQNSKSKLKALISKPFKWLGLKK